MPRFAVPGLKSVIAGARLFNSRRDVDLDRMNSARCEVGRPVGERKGAAVPLNCPGVGAQALSAACIR